MVKLDPTWEVCWDCKRFGHIHTHDKDIMMQGCHGREILFTTDELGNHPNVSLR